jgi:hypothetical protein
MSYEFYKIIHILGIALVVLSLGGIFMHVINGGTKTSNAFRKGAIISHGIGLVLVLVAGFGMLAKLQLDMGKAWVVGKIVIWVLLGALVAVAYRKPQLASKLWFGVPILVTVAAVLAVFKYGA